MTLSIPTNHKANLVGGAFMIVSMAGFAVEDVFLKAASETLPLGQLLIIFGIGGVLVFGAIAYAKGESLAHPDIYSRPMRVRVFFEIVGRLFYALAITLTQLSSATVILQATPIVVVAGAALIFGESVGWRRWIAILLGLIGVLVIVQPGSDSFSMLSILAVIGTLGFAGRDLASRAAPLSISTTVLGFYGFLAVVIAGASYAVWARHPWVRVEADSAIYCLGAVLFGVAAYASLMKAMRTGEVSAVTPFRYMRLPIGIAFGVFLFGEPLDQPMLIGCGLIVLSGLFILWRGAQTDVELVPHQR